MLAERAFNFVETWTTSREGGTHLASGAEGRSEPTVAAIRYCGGCRRGAQGVAEGKTEGNIPWGGVKKRNRSRKSDGDITKKATN